MPARLLELAPRFNTADGICLIRTCHLSLERWSRKSDRGKRFGMLVAIFSPMMRNGAFLTSPSLIQFGRPNAGHHVSPGIPFPCCSAKDRNYPWLKTVSSSDPSLKRRIVFTIHRNAQLRRWRRSSANAGMSLASQSRTACG